VNDSIKDEGGIGIGEGLKKNKTLQKLILCIFFSVNNSWEWN